MGEYIDWPSDKEYKILVKQYHCSFPINEHKHDFVELVYIARGSCRHKYFNTEVTLLPGDVFVVVPDEEHSYSFESETLIYNCLFYPDILQSDWDEIRYACGLFDLFLIEPFFRTEAGRQEILHLNPMDASGVEFVLDKMIEEQDRKYPGFVMIQKSYLVILLTTLGRVWAKQYENLSKDYLGKREMISSAFDFIEKNITNSLKVEDLAATVFLSPSYFRKIFKEVTGRSTGEYINSLRVSKACRLLKEDNITISQVSENVGIADLNYFSRLFREAVGCSPTEFRKKNRLC